MLGKTCHVVQLGLVDYLEALELQERLVRERQAGHRGDTVVLLQHPPVITMGRRGNQANILVSREDLARQGIGLHEVNRGGDVTYHGPGQLVGYPVLRLADHGNDVYRYLRMLEEAVILCLQGYGLHTEQQPGYTGVWMGSSKIAAIGVAIKGGVTMHGFALNVDPNLDHFRFIHPCGYTDRGVTSMASALGRSPDFKTVRDAFVKAFGRVFGTRMVKANLVLGDDSPRTLPAL
ncbi:MAG: lipoyl(octanoyl) transferase LipB [Dehalococcoidia bacterium]|nr:lipoyl(octanoyl) transferase LipB [Dehalococcoidia bacterium]